MAVWTVGGKAGVSLISNEQGGLGIFGDGDLAGEAESAHDLIGGVLDGWGAHALDGHSREADHEPDNCHDDQKLDEGEGVIVMRADSGSFNHNRAFGKCETSGSERVKGHRENGGGDGRGRSPRWITFVVLRLCVRLGFHFTSCRCHRKSRCRFFQCSRHRRTRGFLCRGLGKGRPCRRGPRVGPWSLLKFYWL